MSGTKLGGLKARKKMIEKYGADFWKNIGSKGGKVTGRAKGFAANPDRAREAGRKGGSISRRTLVNDTDFILMWNGSDSIDQIAEWFGVRRQYCGHRAATLRRQGFKLRDRRYL